MAIQHKRRIVNLPIIIAAILFCLTLISIHLSSSLYARYSSSANDSDTTRVIRFGDITLTESPSPIDASGNLVIIPGVTIQKDAQVSFTGSEAMTYIFVEVSLSSHWQMTDNQNFSINDTHLQWQIANGWEHVTSSSPEGGKHIYCITLAPNETLTNHDILSGGEIAVSPYITATDLAEMHGVYIHLRAFAIQGNGFDSEAEAWAAISAP